MNNRLQNRLKQSCFTNVDVAALFVFVAVWAYYIVTVRYGVCTADEGYYWTVPQRLAHGDRLLVDEWCVGQFFPVFLYLPYKIFVAIAGSTAGIMLFSRYLFLAVNAVFYWRMYAMLRANRWSALLASLLFALYVPLVIFCCSYYTMAVRLLMLVCLVLFRDKKTPLSLLFGGVLLACAVLNQPGFALLYAGFTVLVWIRFFRQRKGKRFLDDFAFCLETRTWKYITLSVVVCAAVFLCWLFARSGLRDALRSVPYTLIDPEYDFSAGGNARSFFLQKILASVQDYGLYCVIPALLTIVLSAVYARGLFGEKRETVRRVLFGLACALWILSCILSFRLSRSKMSDHFFFSYGVPAFWFGLVCYLLGSRKNKRFLFFWVVSLCASLCVDFISDVAVSVGSPISYIADLVFFTDLVRELCPEHPFQKLADRRANRLEMRKKGAAARKKARAGTRKPRKDVGLSGADSFVLWCTRLTCACFAVWIGFICTFESPTFTEHYLLGTPLFSQALSPACTQGPWRSLKITQDSRNLYDVHLADMDLLMEKHPKSLYICGLAPELYLYTDLPYATYCSWTFHKEAYLEREVLYWTLHPERLPEYIYISFYDADGRVPDGYYRPVEEATLDWVRDNLDPLCEYTAELANYGYILRVSQWHLPQTK